MRHFCVAALTASLLVSVSAGASALEHPWQGSYVRYLQGEAYGRSRDAVDFGRLELNMPLEEGDELLAGDRSLLGVGLYGGAVIWLGEGSGLKLISVFNGPGIEMSQGRVFLRNPDSSEGGTQLTVSVLPGTVCVEPGSLVDLEVDAEGRLEASVWSGSAQVYAGPASISLLARQRAVVQPDGASFHSATFVPEPADSFERSVLALERRSSKYSARRYMRRYVDGSDLLQDYGTWYYDGYYKSYAWRPRVAASWRPFMRGRWIAHPGGWFWVSADPWGWATCHYGKWALNYLGRWCWVPGYSFSPARVSFYSFGSYYAWAPAGIRLCGSGGGYGCVSRYDCFVYSDQDRFHHGSYGRRGRDGRRHGDRRPRALTQDIVGTSKLRKLSAVPAALSRPSGPVTRFLRQQRKAGSGRQDRYQLALDRMQRHARTRNEFVRPLQQRDRSSTRDPGRKRAVTARPARRLRTTGSFQTLPGRPGPETAGKPFKKSYDRPRQRIERKPPIREHGKHRAVKGYSRLKPLRKVPRQTMSRRPSSFALPPGRFSPARRMRPRSTAPAPFRLTNRVLSRVPRPIGTIAVDAALMKNATTIGVRSLGRNSASFRHRR